jgi:hypothetical protein
MKTPSLIPVERIEKAIYLIRGQKVMLDADLAALYRVTTKALNQAVDAIESDFQRISCFR